MTKRKESPKKLAARVLRWMQTPEGKKELREAGERSKEMAAMFKQRPFTAEELNQRY